MSPKRRIRVLNEGQRFWAIAQIGGAKKPVQAALDLCQAYAQPGDHFIFLGSQIGAGGHSREIIAHILAFATWCRDQGGEVTWLRGIQEELMDRFYTLHFAQDPHEVLTWMCQTYDLDKTLADFGCDFQALESAFDSGAAALAQLTAQFRQSIYGDGDLRAYFEGCARAAVSDNGQLLFVHAGVDPARPLSLQTDAFWWGHPDFFRQVKPYQNFSRVISTLNPSDNFRLEGPGRLAFDGGAVHGGPLLLICFDPRGRELFDYRF